MSYAKNVTLSQEIYAALEKELQEIERSLGFTRQKRLAHRHYLRHDMGKGTPSQRQKQSEQLRLSQAIDNVFQKKFEKALENPNDKEIGPYTGDDHWLKASSRNWITHSIEKLADDQIREAMSRGDFTKLEGTGKPIKHAHNSVALDHTTHRLNKMLIDSGFAPEWVNLDKEIRLSVGKLRERIISAWHRLGPHPMTEVNTREWECLLGGFQESLTEINRNVNRLNLIVPSTTMQKVHFNFDMFISSITLVVVPDQSEVTAASQKSSIVHPYFGYSTVSRGVVVDNLDPIASSFARLMNSFKVWYQSIVDRFLR